MATPRPSKRILLWLLVSTALLLAVLSGLLGVVLGTPGGTRGILEEVLAVVPNITVGQIRGTLWRGVTLKSEFKYLFWCIWGN